MMNWIVNHRWLLILLTSLLASCSGGSGFSGTPPPPTSTLTSIALSPLTATVAPGGTTQLTVTGTYSDGSTAILLASDEAFQSSNTVAVTVNADGLATVVVSASAGATATISATDTASGLVTSPTDSTVVTVGSAGIGPPTPSSGQAASATAKNNVMCTAIQPFYWEVGDAGGALASGSSTQVGGSPVTASKTFATASASKWIYAMYVVQKRGGATKLAAADIPFLNFTSGYSNMGSNTQSATCTAPASGADSINHCLTLSGPSEAHDSQDPNTVGKFVYDSGHEENHAGQFQPEINALDASDLGSAIVAGLGVKGITLTYRQPLLTGGIYASANDYTAILRAVLGGQQYMHDALGTDAVCAWVGPGCNAVRSPPACREMALFDRALGRRRCQPG